MNMISLLQMTDTADTGNFCKCDQTLFPIVGGDETSESLGPLASFPGFPTPEHEHYIVGEESLVFFSHMRSEKGRETLIVHERTQKTRNMKRSKGSMQLTTRRCTVFARSDSAATVYFIMQFCVASI